ncbi:VacJ family lipoprotein [Acinetobacter sp.]|uniref:MlaA family lipoprotein n=1 Tax=Acinetobacter sp. TaxID=472 RepID=UPI0028AA52BB|nr:VacJ family lipoprotein [Acinetobacter sp.]
MRQTSFLYAGLLSLVVTTPVFANDESSAPVAQDSEAANKSKTQQLAHAAMVKSSEVAKKLSVNANAAQSEEDKDPFQPINRKVYAFNDYLDVHIARPAAVQYVAKTPKDIRESYRLFRKNLGEPWNAFNQLIQGRPTRAAKSLGRFTVNTLTTLGFADPASRLGLEAEDENFGATLGYYGIPSGPYIVLPVLGPSTLRQTVGLAVDSQGRPQKYMLDGHDVAYWSEQTLRGIDTRAQLLDIEGVLQGDKYAQIRDIYLQRLNYSIAEKKGIAEENLFIDEEDDDIDESEDNSTDVSTDDSTDFIDDSSSDDTDTVTTE